MSVYPVWVCRSLDEQLPYPHYSDSRWDKPVCVFGSLDAPCDEGAYSDRLAEWDYDKWKTAWASITADPNTPRAVQEYLSAYYARPVALVSIQMQTNRATGYAVSYYRWNWVQP